MTKKELLETLKDVPDDAIIHLPQYDDLHGVCYYNPILNGVSKETVPYYLNKSGHKVYMSKWSHILDDGEEAIYVLETF